MATGAANSTHRCILPPNTSTSIKLGTDLSADASQLCKHLLSLETADGSWSVAPDYRGDISPTAEAYLALRILDHEADSKELLRARDFIREAGGLAKVRI